MPYVEKQFSQISVECVDGQLVFTRDQISKAYCPEGSAPFLRWIIERLMRSEGITDNVSNKIINITISNNNGDRMVFKNLMVVDAITRLVEQCDRTFRFSIFDNGISSDESGTIQESDIREVVVVFSGNNVFKSSQEKGYPVRIIC